MLAAPGVPRIELNGSLIDALQLPGIPDGNWGGFLVGVLTVALIASVESLLTAVAVDRMTGPRSNLDRELAGQGAANMVSGAIGGLPITGVIVRSSANVAAGARTRASSMLHGFWVLVFALPFAGLAEQIPMAGLAGLLIVIGVQLVRSPTSKPPAHRRSVGVPGDRARGGLPQPAQRRPARPGALDPAHGVAGGPRAGDRRSRRGRPVAGDRRGRLRSCRCPGCTRR